MPNTGPIQTRARILSWNVWWQFGPWQERAPAILATLRHEDPDIIALQEVWGDGAVSFARQLADDLGYYAAFDKCSDMNGVGFGNAILSRWPILKTDSVELYGREETLEARRAMFTLVDGPRGTLPVFCTHLNWRFEHSHIRQRQVTDLARFVADHPKQRVPPVLCGDFNAEPDSHEMRMLTGLETCPVEDQVFFDAWRAAGNGPGFSWSNANPFAAEEMEPDRRIDYILTGHPKARGRGHVTACRLAGDKPVKGIWPSDHLAVLAEIRY